MATQSLCQQGGVNSGGSDTFTGANTGTASSDRVNTYIFQPTNSPSAVTINGITANFSVDNSLGAFVVVASAINPTGTTANIVATGSGGYEIIGGWATIGNPNPVQTSFLVQLGSASPTIPVVGGGVVIGNCFDAASVGPTVSFTGGISNEGTQFLFLGTAQCQAGGGNFTNAQTVTCTFTGATTPASVLVALAPFYIPYDPWPQLGPVTAQKHRMIGWTPNFDPRRRWRKRNTLFVPKILRAA